MTSPRVLVWACLSLPGSQPTDPTAAPSSRRGARNTAAQIAVCLMEHGRDAAVCRECGNGTVVKWMLNLLFEAERGMTVSGFRICLASPRCPCSHLIDPSTALRISAASDPKGSRLTCTCDTDRFDALPTNLQILTRHTQWTPVVRTGARSHGQRTLRVPAPSCTNEGNAARTPALPPMHGSFPTQPRRAVSRHTGAQI